MLITSFTTQLCFCSIKSDEDLAYELMLNPYYATKLSNK